MEGTLGQYDRSYGGEMYLVESAEDVARLEVRDPTHLAFVTQTTLSVDDARVVIDALRARFPLIEGPRKDDICYATQNRQDAVRELAKRCDLILVVGSANSSNSNRLRELSETSGVTTYLIDRAEDINPRWLEGKQRIGVTAGASAPEKLVQDVVGYLRNQGARVVEEQHGREEKITFSLPVALRG